MDEKDGGVFGQVGLLEPVTVALVREPAPLPVGTGFVWDAMADGRVVLSDPDEGRLLLAAGRVYQVTISGAVRFDAANVEVRAVIAGDVRFRGPSVRVEQSKATRIADELADVSIALDVAPARRRARDRGDDDAVTRPFAASGLVRVPPGPEPVSLEVYASVEPAGPVEFLRCELSAVGVGTIGGG